MNEQVMDEVKKGFRPEFLNRLDGVVVFHALSRDHILEIVDMMLGEVRDRVLEQGLVLQITDAARDHLAETGYDPYFGARPLRRVIQEKIEDRLSDELLAGAFKAGDVVELDLEDEEFVVKVPKHEAPPESESEGEPEATATSS
jgi:ATP-dependent Clp protease ATP-binding subunit ClpC